MLTNTEVLLVLLLIRFYVDLRMQLTNVITGNILKAAENALKLEQERLQKYKEFEEKTRALGLSSNKVMLKILPF